MSLSLFDGSTTRPVPTAQTSWEFCNDVLGVLHSDAGLSRLIGLHPNATVAGPYGRIAHDQLIVDPSLP